MKNVQYISCGGGGTKGIMYFGMLSALEEHLPNVIGMTLSEYLQQILGFAGTSVGALASLMLLLNLSPERAHDVFAPQLASMRTIMPRPDLSMLVTMYGLDDGQALRDLIHTALRAGGICEDATFNDIRRLLKRDYVCVATDVHTKNPVYFSVHTTPNMKIVDAVYMSMCIPFVFVPMHHHDRMCVDGSLSHNVPRYFADDLTLFIDFDQPEQATKVENLNDYIMAIFGMTTDTSFAYREHEHLLLRLPTTMANEYAMNFDVSPTTTLMRIHCGYASTLMYLYPDFMSTIVFVLEMAYFVALEHQQLMLVIGDEASTY